MASSNSAKGKRTMPVLSADGLTFSVGGSFRVGPVDLTVEKGGTVGIVGETGSGKSLLCRTLVGMLGLAGGTVESGSLRVCDEDMTTANRSRWAQVRRRHVGYMPQASMSGLNPVRRIGSQLTEVLYGDRANRKRQARELMEQVRMRDPDRVLRAYPHELSGGMRQRVMLAFALIGDPELLVADEPTTALDPTVQSEVLSLIARIQAERSMSVVIVSHDMRVIRKMCDWVAVMYRGTVVESGPLSQIMEHSQHPYTRALLQADPARAQRKTLLGVIENAPETAEGWSTRGMTPNGARKGIEK